MKDLRELASVVSLNPEDVDVTTLGFSPLLGKEEDVDAYHFLAQAESDYERGGSGAKLNVITNANRAILCQLDQTLTRFGYSVRGWKTPKKIERLNQLGIIAPRILKRVSKSRNLLEHEYKLPSDDEIEEALDLATLFILATKATLQWFPDELEIGNGSEITNGTFPRGLCVGFRESPTPQVVVTAFPKRKRNGFYSKGPTAVVPKNHPAFCLLIKIAVTASRGYGLEEVLKAFCEQVCLAN